MAMLRRLFACALCVFALCASADVAHAQGSYHQRQERLRRLAADRERAGDRYETERRREEHCAEVGQAECDREAARSARELNHLFVFPALRYALAGALALCAFMWWRVRSGRRRALGRLPPLFASRSSSKSSLDVVVVDVALDPATASGLRASIDRAVARQVSLEPALRDAAHALLETRGSWTYAAVRSWPIASIDVGEERYRALVVEARTRATRDARELREPTPGYRGTPAAESDHAPLVMVSLTVCSLDEIPELGGAVVEAVSSALRALTSLPTDRVYRADLTWLPDPAGEALPAIDLLALHPRLIPLHVSATPITQPATFQLP